MVNYRRLRLEGGTYFFTVTLADRGANTLVAQVDCLREAFRAARLRRPFVVEAVVILPEHLHTIWTLPPGDTDYGARWNHVKSAFSRAVAQRLGLHANPNGELPIWQRRFWEHAIRDEDDFQRHCDYIHYNPVKHGWAASAAAWPYSSFQRFVDLGWYTADWGRSVPDDPGNFGE